MASGDATYGAPLRISASLPSSSVPTSGLQWSC